MDSGRVDGHKVGFSVSVGAEKDDPVSFQERDGVSEGVRVFKTHGRGELHGMGRVVETVRFIDSAGQIHLEETGLALIPGVDEYEIVK